MTSPRIGLPSIALCVVGLLALGIAGGQDERFGGAGKKPEKPPKPSLGVEDKAVLKFAEKAAKPVETERDKWIKDLERAFPGRVSAGLGDADFHQWFDLVAGGGHEWRQGPGSNKKLNDLFERARERLQLGPNDEVRRDEFLRYARMNLLPGTSPPWKADKTPSDLDKLFRELDRDASGFLEQSEWTERLFEASRRTDANRDGRIDRAEYAAYIQGRVATTIERGPKPPPQERSAKATVVAATPPPEAQPEFAVRAGHLPKELPGWFAEIDFNHDGQVELWEWRRSPRRGDEFFQLDLDRDGLLYPDEYLRAIRILAAEAKAASGSLPDDE